MSDPIHLDPSDVLAVTRARAAQTYSDLLDEIVRLTVYATGLAREVEELKARLPEQPS